MVRSVRPLITPESDRNQRSNTGTWSTLHVMRQKLQMGEISKEDYETVEKRILLAQSHIENTAMQPKIIETNETRRLRAKIMEIEKRRRAVSKELKKHLEQCARDDLARVRLGLLSSHTQSIRHEYVGDVSILKEYEKIYTEREVLAKKLATTINET